MKNCPVCNTQIDDNAATCPVCMSPVSVASPSAPQAPAYQQPAYEVPASQATPQQPATQKPNAAGDVVNKVKSLGKDVSKKVPKKALMIGAIAVVALVLVIVLISALTGGTKAYDYALYIKDGEMYAAKLSNRKPWQVTDEPGSTYAFLSKDGKKIFFNDEDGDLYYRTVGSKKDPVKVASNVYASSAHLNEAGNRITYTKDGKLYAGSLKEQEKIASDVDYISAISSDGKRGVYKDTDGDLHFWNGKKTEKIGTGSLYWAAENCKTVYFMNDGDLYEKAWGKDKVKIADDVARCYFIENGTGYYTTADEDDETATLYYYNGSKGKEIAKDVASIRDYATDAAVIVYKVEDDIFVAVKAKTSELKQEEGYNFTVSPEGKSVYFMQDYDEETGTGTLFMAKISSSKVKEPEQIDEDVYEGYFAEEGKFFYAKDVENDHGDLYLNNSKKQVDTDVYLDSMDYSEEKGMLVYYTDYENGEGTLKIYKSKAVSVADDVYSFTLMPDGEVLFLQNYDMDKYEGTLMVYTGSGKAKQIDEDVSRIIRVYKIYE